MDNVRKSAFCFMLVQSLLAIAAFAATPAKLVLHVDMKAGMLQREKLIGLLRDAEKDGYNAVLWEVEDKVRFDACPDVAYKEAYSKAEFKEILAVAEKLGLEPIPLLQTFGHAEYVLSRAKYAHLREKADNFACYCVQKREVRELLAALLTEYLDLFGPAVKEFHLGGDEARVFGTCQVCATRKKGELYADHLKFLASILKARGVKPGIWCDMVLAELDDEAAELVPPEYTIWHWDYVFGNGDKASKWTPKLGSLLRRGYDVIFCGASQSSGDDPFLVRYSFHANNLSASAAYAREHALKGFCVTSWSVRAGPKAIQRPLFAFAAKRFLSPDADMSKDLRVALGNAFGEGVPFEALLRASEGDGRTYNFDYRDCIRHYGPELPFDVKRRREPSSENVAAARALADKASAALVELKSVPREKTTPLFADFIKGLELKVAFFSACARWDKPGPKKAPLMKDVAAYFASEETSASAAISARAVLARLE